METIEVKQSIKILVSDYINELGQKKFDHLYTLLSDDVEFTGPNRSLRGANEYVTAIRGLGSILLRNDIKRVFVDGNEACVIYDFVTDTEVGIVPTVEWLTFKQGKISAVRLIFDRYRWNEVKEEMTRRLSK